mmetsp:Transcript_18866/g.53283  ORF Transcript_18866/g.53283 Transcript_18866/m.53283 type:complete len:112 (+) Transcript_18866:71-406(+)
MDAPGDQGDPCPPRGRFRAGDAVRGLFSDGEWYLATVERANEDGTYAVAWFDGDASGRVKRPEELRPARYSPARARYEDAAEATAALHQSTQHTTVFLRGRRSGIDIFGLD